MLGPRAASPSYSSYTLKEIVVEYYPGHILKMTPDLCRNMSHLQECRKLVTSKTNL